MLITLKPWVRVEGREPHAGVAGVGAVGPAGLQILALKGSSGAMSTGVIAVGPVRFLTGPHTGVAGVGAVGPARIRRDDLGFGVKPWVGVEGREPHTLVAGVGAVGPAGREPHVGVAGVGAVGPAGAA